MPVLSEKPLPEMIERLVFATDVARPFAGEFRTSLRDPRTQIEMSLRLPDERFASLEETIRDNLKTNWSVPFWHERTRSVDLTVGQTDIPVSTAADYRASGEAIVWQGCDTYEVVTVSSVGSSTITIPSPGLSASYTDAAVMPLHQAFILAPPVLRRANRGLMEVGLFFQLRQNADLGATVWTTYRGYQVLACGGIISALEGAIVPPVEYIDSGLGVVTIENARATDDLRFAIELSDQAWNIKRFMHEVRGRDYPFWVRAWGGRLTLLSGQLAAYDQITVSTTRPAADLVGRHVSVNGIYREISAASDNSSDTTLTLDSALGADVAAGAPVHLLNFVRAEADEVEIQHRHGFASSIVLPVVEVTGP